MVFLCNIFQKYLDEKEGKSSKLFSELSLIMFIFYAVKEY